MNASSTLDFLRAGWSLETGRRRAGGGARVPRVVQAPEDQPQVPEQRAHAAAQEDPRVVHAPPVQHGRHEAAQGEPPSYVSFFRFEVDF